MRVTWLLRLYGGGGGYGAIGGRTRVLLLPQLGRKRKQHRSARTAASPSTVTFCKPTSPRRQRRAVTNDSSGRRRCLKTRPFTPATVELGQLSLADFHPAIARTWVAAASSKMLQPQHVSPDSRKLVWWICPACHHQYTRRVDLHLAAGGACPQCKAKPSLSPTSTPSALGSPSQRQGRQGSVAESASSEKTGKKAKAVTTTSSDPLQAAIAVIAHKCRPQSSQATLAADNANLLSKSLADDQYLRVHETRNLLPMLAKNFDKEKAKIGTEEKIWVSPKLDGIRCIVAFRADTRQVLFFSRSGTLFECCDDAIEPAVRRLFEMDPTLVLDGELYNDSVNLAQLTMLQETNSAASFSLSSTVPSAAFYAMLLAAAEGGGSRGSRSRQGVKKAGKGSKTSAASSTASALAAKPAVIRFEQLTSAIRTTRQHLTPDVAALQRQLQYHVFDVLYAREFPNGSAATVPFSARYAFIQKLLTEAAAYNTAHLRDYNPLVLRRVPSYACTLDSVDALLRAAMRVGYEGVMVRRDCKGKHTGSAVQHAKAKLRRAVASSKAAARGQGGNGDASSGGYGYGQRSSTLLKYKVMQDAEYVIVGAVEGSGKWKGSLGAFICVTSDQKHRFTVTPASTDAEKKRMWKTWKQEYLGQALTVQYQELTPDGVPRFPVGKCVRGAADGLDWI